MSLGAKLGTTGLRSTLHWTCKKNIKANPKSSSNTMVDQSLCEPKFKTQTTA